jgi:hypothetical protein
MKFFCWSEDRFLRVSESLYDSKNRVAKIILISEPLASKSITINKFNELDCLRWQKKYNIVEGIPEFHVGYERVYDSHNRHIELILHHPDGSHQLAYRNEYDESGVLLERDHMIGEKEVYTYFDDGRVATMRWQYTDSDLSIGQLYRYDERNRVVAKEHFMARGGNIPESREGNVEEFDYDDQGRLVEKRLYDPNFGFSPRGRITYEYY